MVNTFKSIWSFLDVAFINPCQRRDKRYIEFVDLYLRDRSDIRYFFLENFFSSDIKSVYVKRPAYYDAKRKFRKKSL